MRNILIIILVLAFSINYAQEKRTIKLNKEKNLYEVVYYHDNGEVSQTGFFNKEGKLHGQWFSYCKEGNKIVSANYENGKKVGKWFYWDDQTLKEVDYDKNRIVTVNTWLNSANNVTSN